MDVRTPALILLCSVLVALSLSVLGLSADNVAYVNNNRDSTIDLQYLRWNSTADNMFSYRVQIDYLPSKFDMGRVNAMLAASVLSVVLSLSIAVASWKARGHKTTTTGVTLKNKTISLSLLSTALASIIFAISFAVAIYAWYPVMQWSINFKNSLPLPPSITGSKSTAIMYQSPFDLTPDIWNCWVSEYAVNPAVGGKLRSLCHEATVAKELMLPIVILSAALVVLTTYGWWKASRIPASTPEEQKKDVEEISI